MPRTYNQSPRYPAFAKQTADARLLTRLSQTFTSYGMPRMELELESRLKQADAVIAWLAAR
jgi:hypothetical protein